MFQVTQQGPPFLSFRLSDFISLGGLALMALKYVRDRGDDLLDRQKNREATIRETTEHHVENRGKLDVLMSFQKDQLVLNKQRDEQIIELKTQTSVLTALSTKMDLRISRIEDRG